MSFDKTFEFLNWRLIKSIAELQIITKASYSMIIFVPILASMWTGVRLYVNNHSDAITKATQVLENNSRNMEGILNQLNDTSVDKLISKQESSAEKIVNEMIATSQNFSSEVSRFSKDFPPQTLTNKNFPWTWVAAFFVALMAIIAQLLYQILAPKIIQRFTLDEYLSARKKTYIDHSYEELNSLYSPTDILPSNISQYYEKTRKMISNSDDCEENLKGFPAKELMSLLNFARINEVTDKNKTIAVLEKALKGKSKNTRAAKEEKLGIIEKGAKDQYLIEARKIIGVAIFVGVLYMIAIYVILEIIYFQSISIMASAEWDNILSLFDFPRIKK